MGPLIYTFLALLLHSIHYTYIQYTHSWARQDTIKLVSLPVTHFKHRYYFQISMCLHKCWCVHFALCTQCRCWAPVRAFWHEGCPAKHMLGINHIWQCTHRGTQSFLHQSHTNTISHIVMEPPVHCLCVCVMCLILKCFGHHRQLQPCIQWSQNDIMKQFHLWLISQT